MNPWMKYLKLDEVTQDSGVSGGGGSGPDLKVDVAAAVDEIGADLGLGEPENKGEGADPNKDGSATPPAKKDEAALAADKAGAAARERAGKLEAARKALADKKIDLTGKSDDEVLKLAEEAAKPAGRPLPKSYKKEMEAHWNKLAPEVQAYIEQREAEVEEGFKRYGDDSRYAKTMREVLQAYEPLLQAQGVKDPAHAVRTVMNAHYVLSTFPADKKAAFMAQLAQNYGVDLNAVVEAAKAGGQRQETPEMREQRERLDRLEAERKAEIQARYDALKAQSAAEVEAFASDPKHPYFKEVASEVALLLQDPNLTLEEAYNRAIYANPVTREKELARLKAEAEKSAKEEAEKAAAAAEKARGTRIRGKEEERSSADPLGSMEDTMRETLRGIKSRQE